MKGGMDTTRVKPEVKIIQDEFAKHLNFPIVTVFSKNVMKFDLDLYFGGMISSIYTFTLFFVVHILDTHLGEKKIPLRHAVFNS